MQASNRNDETNSGRYLQPEPLLSEPSFVAFRANRARTLPAYAYASSNPIGLTDPTGRYSVEGPCNTPNVTEDKAEIELIALQYAEKLEEFESLCGLNSFKECVKAQVADVKVTCNENTTLECSKPRSDGPLGAYVVDRGSCGAPTDRIFWCNLKLTADQAARILVHEAAHTCGWGHCQGHGVPGDLCKPNELR